jgi:hypothetical protein
MILAAMAVVFVFGVELMSHVMNTYARLPVTFSHGQWLPDYRYRG